MILNFSFSLLLLFLWNQNVAASSPIHIANTGTSYFLVLDVDEISAAPSVPSLPDDEVKTVSVQIEFNGAPGGRVTYSFYKCGMMIFNSTTSTDANFNLIFQDEWIGLFLNGSNTSGQCESQDGRRELIIMVSSTLPVNGAFTFEKLLREELYRKFGYSTVVSMDFHGKMKNMVPLEGVLKIQDELDQYFPITVSSDSEQSFEMGVCNSTFLKIEETHAFSRSFTDNEKRILSLMKNVHCENWRSDLYESNYFIRSLLGTGNLKIEASFKNTSNLLKDEEALTKLVML